MARTGRPPKLAAIRMLEGNPGKRLIKDSKIKVKGDPFVAEHLTNDAKACVELICDSMPPETYGKVDGFLLAAYGMAWAVHKRACEEIARDFENANVTTGFLWITILNKQAGQLATLGARLGLDPQSRVSLSNPLPEKEVSKFDGLLGQNELLTSLSASQSQAAKEREARSV